MYSKFFTYAKCEQSVDRSRAVDGSTAYPFLVARLYDAFKQQSYDTVHFFPWSFYESVAFFVYLL